MAKNTVVNFTAPSELSPDPLTDVFCAGVRELLASAVRAEVPDFILMPALDAYSGFHFEGMSS